MTPWKEKKWFYVILMEIVISRKPEVWSRKLICSILNGGESLKTYCFLSFGILNILILRASDSELRAFSNSFN